MRIINLYSHNGSKNHGCEAIIRSTSKILKILGSVCLYSYNKDEDVQFNLDSCLPIVQTRIKRSNGSVSSQVKRVKIKKIIKKIVPLFIVMKLQKYFGMKNYQDIAKAKGDLFISIGGDIYCYDSYAILDYLNVQINKHSKTILWGCSITPNRIKQDKNLRKDLKRYSLITARESLTYNALIENGINKNTHLFPDPAFLLDKEIPKDLPNNFIPNKTVGLNLSPMVQRLEKENNIAYENFVELINYIINNTNMNIALIPHVIWESNNDLEPLTKLYNKFKNTNRICLIDKPYNACQLKGIISQCRFMIAARTHASIAAYSTQVPTLVIGYSVKAKGIAKDIFGDYKDYVLPIQELKEKTEIVEAFKKLMQNETKIREHYKSFMPTYIEKTWLAGKEVEKLLNN